MAMKVKDTGKLISSDIKISRRVLSQNQQILSGMFGGGVGKRVLGDVRPKILNTLNSGFGLIKNGDNGYTASLILPTKSGRKTI